MSASDPTYRWDWKPLTQGNTRPATRITESLSEFDLENVEIRLKLPESTEADIVLTVGDGVTINSSTAGNWDFDFGDLTSATTDEYTPGVYSYELEITDSNATKITMLKGEWPLIARIPDVTPPP